MDQLDTRRKWHVELSRFRIWMVKIVLFGLSDPVPGSIQYCLDVCIIADKELPSILWKLSPGHDRWKERSKTFTGIAQAMAEQWG